MCFVGEYSGGEEDDGGGVEPPSFELCEDGLLAITAHGDEVGKGRDLYITKQVLDGRPLALTCVTLSLKRLRAQTLPNSQPGLLLGMGFCSLC